MEKKRGFSENKESGFEFLEHPADVWVHAWGPTKENAFSQCVNSLMKTMCEGWPEKIDEKESRDIVKQDVDLESLLVAFLTEYLYIFDVDELVFKKTQVFNIEKISDDMWKITAKSWGEKFNYKKHLADTEVKAITYSYIEIDEKPEKTEIKIIYDI